MSQSHFHDSSQRRAAMSKGRFADCGHTASADSFDHKRSIHSEHRIVKARTHLGSALSTMDEVRMGPTGTIGLYATNCNGKNHDT